MMTPENEKKFEWMYVKLTSEVNRILTHYGPAVIKSTKELAKHSHKGDHLAAFSVAYKLRDLADQIEGQLKAGQEAQEIIDNLNDIWK